MTISNTKHRPGIRGTDVGQSLSVHAGKVHLRAGRQYLHFSGGFLTDNRDHAWIGTIEQARACRRTFDAAVGCKATPSTKTARA